MLQDFKSRTKRFAIEIIKFSEKFPNNSTGRAFSNQIIRSGTSVGANYRAACRAKSTADFVNKLKIVEEEADETAYWLELIKEISWFEAGIVEQLLKEANEIIAITVTSIKNKKANLKS